MGWRRCGASWRRGWHERGETTRAGRTTSPPTCWAPSSRARRRSWSAISTAAPSAAPSCAGCAPRSTCFRAGRAGRAAAGAARQDPRPGPLGAGRGRSERRAARRPPPRLAQRLAAGRRGRGRRPRCSPPSPATRSAVATRRRRRDDGRRRPGARGHRKAGDGGRLRRPCASPTSTRCPTDKVSRPGCSAMARSNGPAGSSSPTATARATAMIPDMHGVEAVMVTAEPRGRQRLPDPRRRRSC